MEGRKNDGPRIGVMNQGKTIEKDDGEISIKNTRNIAAFVTPNLGCGRGRGRYLTVPAWMEGRKSDEESVAVMQQDEEIKNNAGHNNNNTSIISNSGRGRGRGSTIPFWMESGGNNSYIGDAVTDIEHDDKHKKTSVGDNHELEVTMFLNSVVQETHTHSSSFNSTIITESEEENISAPKPVVGMGRGRGLTIPAWMKDTDMNKIGMTIKPASTITTASSSLPSLAYLHRGKAHRITISNEGIDYDKHVIDEKSIVPVGNGCVAILLMQ